MLRAQVRTLRQAAPGRSRAPSREACVRAMGQLHSGPRGCVAPRWCCSALQWTGPIPAASQAHSRWERCAQPPTPQLLITHPPTRVVQEEPALRPLSPQSWALIPHLWPSSLPPAGQAHIPPVPRWPDPPSGMAPRSASSRQFLLSPRGKEVPSLRTFLKAPLALPGTPVARRPQGRAWAGLSAAVPDVHSAAGQGDDAVQTGSCPFALR